MMMMIVYDDNDNDFNNGDDWWWWRWWSPCPPLSALWRKCWTGCPTQPEAGNVYLKKYFCPPGKPGSFHSSRPFSLKVTNEKLLKSRFLLLICEQIKPGQGLCAYLWQKGGLSLNILLLDSDLQSHNRCANKFISTALQCSKAWFAELNVPKILALPELGESIIFYDNHFGGPSMHCWKILA